MEANDKPNAAFITRKDLFPVLPFGLFNSPVTFERLMAAVLSGLQWDICLIYLNHNLEVLMRLWKILSKFWKDKKEAALNKI